MCIKTHIHTHRYTGKYASDTLHGDAITIDPHAHHAQTHETPCHSCCTKMLSQRTSDMTQRCLYHRHTRHTPTHACMHTHTNTHNMLSERPPNISLRATFVTDTHTLHAHIRINLSSHMHIHTQYTFTETLGHSLWIVPHHPGPPPSGSPGLPSHCGHGTGEGAGKSRAQWINLVSSEAS